jgi:thioredoxin reductase (NADPH)
MTEDRKAGNGTGSDNPFGGLTIDLSGGLGGPVAEIGGPTPSVVSAGGRTESKVLIIGSGPAGLTAAIYAARANLEPIVLAGSAPGGQLMITSDVENYPGFPLGIQGPELMAAFREQAERFGSQIMDVDIDRVDFSSRPFRVWARGVEYKGDTALEEATFLTRFASKVHLLHRRDQFRASKIMLDRAVANPKIEIHPNTAVDEVLGTNKVEGLMLRDTETGKQREVPMEGLFIAIGYRPNTEVLRDWLEVDEKGYLVVHDETGSKIEGVFIAGDVHDHRYRQAVTAAGDGCKAAIDAERWLESQGITEAATATAW